MRFRGWARAALIVVVVLGVTGCTGLSNSQVRDFLTSVGKTQAVLRETHVDDSAAGYCQQTCYEGSATLVVSTKLSESRVIAIRDQITNQLEAAHIDGFAMTLTLQQGPNHITLDATHAQYAAWTKLRHLSGMHGVNMDASAWVLNITNRATIEVTANSRSIVVPVLKNSATEIVSSGVFGKRIFLTARTPDGRYYVAVDAHADPLPFLDLDQQVLTDPTLTGGSVDKSPLGGYGIVGIRVPSLRAVPDTYLRYDGVVAAYPGMYVHTVDFPGGNLSVFGHVSATDPAMIALRDVIATGAHLSTVGIEQAPGRPTSLTFEVPTDADATLLNSVILSHPELNTLAFYRVTSKANQGGTSVWDFGVAANE
jgi:hypothetical protein